jgi:large repetitive protein
LGITPTSVPPGTVGTAYSQTMSPLNGTAPFTWTISAGALPVGLTFSAAGLISGTPTTSAVYNFTVQVKDATGATATQALSIPVLPQGSIALVQQGSATTTGAGTLSVALPAAVTAGNAIVVSASGWGSVPAAAPVTDNLGNVYTIAGTQQTTSGASWTALYYAANAKAGVTTVTFATAASSQISMVAAEFSNVAAVTPLDAAIGATGNSAAPASGNMTATALGDLIIGSGTHDVATTTTAGAGFTMVAIATESAANNQPHAMEYQIGLATTPVSAGFTIAAGAPWAQCGALLKHK